VILCWFLNLSLLFFIQDYGTTVASPTGQPVTQIFLNTVGKKGAIVLIVGNVSGEGWYERGRRMGRRERNENGWHGHYDLPASLPSDLPTRTTAGTCGSGGIRVLHTTDDANRGWCGFVAAGSTNNVWNLDVDKAGAVMVMLVITRSSSWKESNVQDTRK
jgi:hypothetical protein